MNPLIIITIYLIGVLFAYMKHCGFICSICYDNSFELNKEDKIKEYIEMLVLMWLSWIWFIFLSIVYFEQKNKYFFKLKL